VVREQELQRHNQTRHLLQMLEELEADNEEKREIANKAAMAKQALNNSLVDVIREQETKSEDANEDEAGGVLLPPPPENHVVPVAAPRANPRRQGQRERAQLQAPPVRPVLDPAQAALNPEDAVSGSFIVFIELSRVILPK
jgi:hypothetical protein